MDDVFDLPVLYKDEELFFPARLQQTGYTHRFEMDVYGTTVYFEPDEERNYRAVLNPSYPDKIPPLDLLQAISTGIEAVLR